MYFAETSVCINLYLPRPLFCWILLLKTLTRTDRGWATRRTKTQLPACADKSELTLGLPPVVEWVLLIIPYLILPRIAGLSPCFRGTVVQ